MKRIAILLAAAVIGATAVPAAAEAQGRGRPGMECPQGPAGKACRQAQSDRGGRDDDRGSQRSRPPRGGDDYETQRTRPPGRGGNSLGDSWSPRAGEAREGVRDGRLVPLEQVIRNIARSTPGQLLDAGLENRGDRPIYRVRWQTNDGRRVDYIVDARTGQIIGRN
jgi:uncharacterized membrane protein YkoI